MGAIGEETGAEAAESAQGSGSAASAQDRPDPELEAMGADFLARSRDFRLEQGRDDVLGRLFDQAAVVNGRVVEPRRAATYPHFEINRDLLYRVDKLPQTGEVRHQLLIPQPFKEDLLQLAHAIPLSGHLGRDKTKARLVTRFYWLGLDGDVRRFCERCGECQKASPRAVPRAPLVPLPLVEAPFERIGMDIVGPLERSAAGYTHLLVILDYATRYPEAIPLRSMSAKSVANELVKVFSRVGIPKEILTDQVTNFMSRLIRGTCKLLGIKTIRTSVFHPQTDGLVERFNKTLNPLRSIVGLGPTLQLFLTGPLSDWVRHHYSNAINGCLVVFSPEKAEKTIQWPSETDRSREKTKKKGGVSHEY